MSTISSSQRVAVIGAGITGTITAYQLLKRGHQVTLFEKHPYAAMETSFANGGQLSASNSEVWNSWGTVLKGCKWLFKPGAPLLVNPKPSWHKLCWMAQFIAAIPRYEENTISTVRLAIAAREHLLQMAKDEDIHFNCQHRGILHFYKTKGEFNAATRVTKLLAKGGLERRAVAPSEMKAIEPALNGDFYGGYYTESDFTGDIHRFTNGLAQACVQKGCDFRFNTSVNDLRATSKEVVVVSDQEEGGGPVADRFDSVVVCSGVASKQFAECLGDKVNIYPVKGYSITVNLDDQKDKSAAPWTSLLDDNAKIVTSRLGKNRFRVAGTAEFNGTNKDIRWSRIEPLIGWCRDHFPGMSTRSVVPWAGLRPMMPNMMPKIGAGNNPRVFYNTGHGHLGWTLSAATGTAVASMVEQRLH